MQPLLATYRLQFHEAFDFAAAAAITPYLERLGVSHAYASPILQARRGSRHGYDVVDPGRVNEELGGDDGRRQLIATLKARGMGFVLDIVPNHMATGDQNPAWDHVLMHGPSSPYARWFDVDWRSDDRELYRRILVPVLGDLRHKVLARDELQLVLAPAGYASGRQVRIRYHEHTFPIDPATLPAVLAPPAQPVYGGLRPPTADQDAAVSLDPGDARELETILSVFRSMPSRNSRRPKQREKRQALAENGLRRLSALVEDAPAVAAHIERTLAGFTYGESGRARFVRLMDRQAYRLAYWRRAAREINYRRFFDINELVALHAEDPQVFDGTHRRILEWVASGQVDGLRIDHVDGLRDPAGYLARLARRITAGTVPEKPVDAGTDPAGPIPVYVEKILGHNEALRRDWQTAGTTGYEFATAVDSVFIHPDGLEQIERYYGHSVLRRPTTFEEVASGAKRRVLKAEFSAYIGRLARLWMQMEAAEGMTPATSLRDAADALTELITAFPVYRTYIDCMPRTQPPCDPSRLGLGSVGDPSTSPCAEDPASRIDSLDRALIIQAARTVERNRGSSAPLGPSRHLGPGVLRRLVDLLLLEGLPASNPDALSRRLTFISRFQQLCSPAAAKGVEDTAFYVYVPLVSRNEVGADPPAQPASNAGDSVDAAEALHRENRLRAEHWPDNLLTVTTHDTKRSADVRARLNVLSEIPDEWIGFVRKWTARHRQHRRKIPAQSRQPGQDGHAPMPAGALHGPHAPDSNTEYLLYQTLVGIWPARGHTAADVPADHEAASRPRSWQPVRERVEAYMRKAAREAKAHTSWVRPNEAFEDALIDFIRAIVPAEGQTPFLNDLQRLVDRIARPGYWNALARTVIQLTAPGVPDLYQGDELWNFSLVDPDNRRPVDFATREDMLGELERRWCEGGEAQARLARELTGSGTPDPPRPRREGSDGGSAGPEDGRIKLHVVHRLLDARKKYPDLFRSGGYTALAVEAGSGNDHDTPAPRAGEPHHIFSFARRSASHAALVIVPRFTVSLTEGPGAAGRSRTEPAGMADRSRAQPPGHAPVGPAVWGALTIRWDDLGLTRLENVLTGQQLSVGDASPGRIAVGDALRDFPVAVLIGQRSSQR